MCMRTGCQQCGKPSFAGCGLHIEQVLRDVPAERRCRCAQDASASAAPPHLPHT